MSQFIDDSLYDEGPQEQEISKYSDEIEFQSGAMGSMFPFTELATGSLGNDEHDGFASFLGRKENSLETQNDYFGMGSGMSDSPDPEMNLRVGNAPEDDKENTFEVIPRLPQIGDIFGEIVPFKLEGSNLLDLEPTQETIVAPPKKKVPQRIKKKKEKRRKRKKKAVTPPPPPPPRAPIVYAAPMEELPKKMDSKFQKADLFKNLEVLKKLVEEHPFSEQVYGKDLVLKPVQKPPAPKDIFIFGIRTLRGGVDFVNELPSMMAGKPYKYEIRLRTSCFHAGVDVDNAKVGFEIDNFDQFNLTGEICEYRFVIQLTSKVGPKDCRDFCFQVFDKRHNIVIGKSPEIEIRSKRTPIEYAFWEKVVKRSMMKRKKLEKRIRKKKRSRRRRNRSKEEEDEDEVEVEELKPSKKKLKL